MATLSLLTPTQDGGAGGLVLAYTAPSPGGDAFPNLNGDVMLAVDNGSSAATTITVTGQIDENGRSENHVLAIAAGSQAHLGPFRTGLFNNAQGNVEFSFSGTDSVGVAAYIPFRPFR